VNVVRIKMYLQSDPKRGAAWCLRLTVKDRALGECVARIWFDEYSDRRQPPPYHVTFPAARLCEHLARETLTTA